MERFKIPDDQPMEASILSRQIENAQKKVEEQNFVSRKNVLKYDDVMNKQRVVIYEQRRRVLEGEDFSEEIKGWIEEVIERSVETFVDPESGDPDLDALAQAMQQLYNGEITADELREDGVTDPGSLVPEFIEDAQEEYAAKEEELGPELMRELERFVILQVVDQRWREHLENMDYLREGVHLRAMAQKDPLVEYTSEGHAMFAELNGQIREEVLTLLFHAQLQAEDAEELRTVQEASAVGDGGLSYEHESEAGAAVIAGALGGEAGSVSTLSRPQQRKVDEHEKLGRNEPCWCGSGKKYKKCHGA
jgi:preprotein translocase subunit SecA